MTEVVTLTLNPSLDINMFFPQPALGVLNRASRSYLEASGKGLNVSAGLAAQGVDSRAVVPLGGPFGMVMDGLLADASYRLQRIAIAGASRANTKVIDEDSGRMTEFNASGPPLSEAELKTCRDAVLEGLSRGDVAVLSGSLPPGVPAVFYAEMVAAVGRAGGAVWVDGSGEALARALAAGPALVKPNRHEAEVLLGAAIRNLGEAEAAARRIGALGAERVVLSLGARGALFLSDEGCLLAQPPSLTARSTTGCGDVLLAGTLIGLMRGWAWDRTARYATAMAAARAVIDGPGFPDGEAAEAMVPGTRVLPSGAFDPDESLDD